MKRKWQSIKNKLSAGVELKTRRTTLVMWARNRQPAFDHETYLLENGCRVRQLWVGLRPDKHSMLNWHVYLECRNG